jgi:ribosomal protein S27AE
MGAGCPGASNLWGTPTLAIKKCPECGSEVEIFSSDVKVRCQKCGFVVFNDIQSCIEWCKYAEKCLGGPLYKQLKTAADEKKKREARMNEAEKKETGKKDTEKKEAGKKETKKKVAGK